jgi:hypothetical protein
MGVKEKPDIIVIIEKKRLQWYGNVKRMPEERIPKLVMEWIPLERTSKKNMDGRSTSSHDDKKFRTRSMEKRRNGFWFPEDGDSCYKSGEIDRCIF